MPFQRLKPPRVFRWTGNPATEKYIEEPERVQCFGHSAIFSIQVVNGPEDCRRPRTMRPEAIEEYRRKINEEHLEQSRKRREEAICEDCGVAGSAGGGEP